MTITKSNTPSDIAPARENPSQRGNNTHHQGQPITPINFKTIIVTVIIITNDTLMPDILICFVIRLPSRLVRYSFF